MIIDLNDYLVLILGWLLGILSPAIVAVIRDQREAEIIKTALLTELRELQYRLVLQIYRIESKHGEINHEFLNWAKSILENYAGITSIKSLLEGIGELLKLPEREIINLVNYRNQQRETKSGIALKKHLLPLLEANMAILNRFDSVLRAHLLEIKTSVEFMNEIAEDARFYFQLSFQNEISQENYAIANANMIDSYKSYTIQARKVAELINKTLNSQ